MLTHQLQGAFEGAYEKAAASSKPEDWMNAALLGKQFSNAYRKLSDSPACAWECASPKDARHQMAFITTKRPTMEHYSAQGWTVMPLFRCPSPALVNVLATIARVREFEGADSRSCLEHLEKQAQDAARYRALRVHVAPYHIASSAQIELGEIGEDGDFAKWIDHLADTIAAMEGKHATE